MQKRTLREDSKIVETWKDFDNKTFYTQIIDRKNNVIVSPVSTVNENQAFKNHDLFSKIKLK